MRKNSFTFLSFFVTFSITLAALCMLYFQMHQNIAGDESIVIVPKTWHIEGNKNLSLKSTSIPSHTFSDKDVIEITYDLHGLCLLGNAASDVILVDTNGNIHDVSLTNFAKNCTRGQQTSVIPLTAFSQYSNAVHFTQFELSFWYPTDYTIDVYRVVTYNAILGEHTPQPTNHDSTIDPSLVSPIATDTAEVASPSATLTPTIVQAVAKNPIATSAAQTYPSWDIQSVSSMKETKDRVCDQRSEKFIEQWVDTAKDLGANYIAVETPYDNPSCGNAVAYTKLWISIIRSRGLKVWHRNMFTSFEGIYNAKKDTSKDYLQLIGQYIRSNPDEYQPGDIFTPVPEPQNGGINGVTYCSQDTCMFSSAKAFNQWLRDAMDVSEQAFTAIGLGGKMKVGYYGFDGFVAWGDNNSRWHGILEQATVTKMGNITIDHYPEVVGETMAYGLNQLQKKYPHTPIVIGEWGTITPNNPVQQVMQSMGAAKRKNIVGFNYWQMGMDGNEALINEDFSHRPTFDAVQSFYKSSSK